MAVLAGGQPVGATPDLRYPGLSSLCPSIPLQVDGSSHSSCSMDDPVHSHKPTMAGWLRDQSLFSLHLPPTFGGGFFWHKRTLLELYVICGT